MRNDFCINCDHYKCRGNREGATHICTNPKTRKAPHPITGDVMITNCQEVRSIITLDCKYYEPIKDRGFWANLKRKWDAWG